MNSVIVKSNCDRVSERRMPLKTFIQLKHDQLLFEREKVSLGLEEVELDREYYVQKLLDQFKKLSLCSGQ